MVAKRSTKDCKWYKCLNLAKIHMVAKPHKVKESCPLRLNLAKIHMVAKQVNSN